MPSVSRPRALAYAAVVLVLLVAGGRFLTSASDADQTGTPGAGGLELVEAEPADAAEVIVHVAGAVRQPGLYSRKEAGSTTRSPARAGRPARPCWTPSTSPHRSRTGSR
jgi:hypothetical protein